MEHDKTLEAEGIRARDLESRPVLKACDRSVPGWIRVVSYFFSAAISLCVLSIAVMALFLQTLLVDEGQLILAPLAVLVGCVPVFGVFLLDFAHGRALAGYREDRRRFTMQAQGAIGFFIAAFLALINPLLALPTLIAGGCSYGLLRLLVMRRQIEPSWDYNAAEAAGILAGRDRFGFQLATSKPTYPALAASVHLVSILVAAVTALAAGGWLAGQEVLAHNSVISVSLMSIWAAHCLGQRALLDSESDPRRSLQANRVVSIPSDMQERDQPDEGFSVSGLKVEPRDGKPLLSDISFRLAPGTIAGVIGEMGGGKSVLLSAIADPFALGGMDVAGTVSLNSLDLWERRARPQETPLAFVPADPLLVPASGLDNLTCLHGELVEERGKRLLEKLVFSSYAVNEICSEQDATSLSRTQKRCLAFARAFLLSPQIYLFERPEDSMPDKQVSALLTQIQQESRMGRCIIMETSNRALLEACDKLLVLQGGRLVDFGDAVEIRARRSSGWARFAGTRRLETEDNLDNWVRSHFKRDGDESNRRNVSLVASELLAFSCQTTSPRLQQTLCFDFKHFEGYCLLKMTDEDAPLTSAQLEKARAEAEESEPGARLSPLATVYRSCLDVEATVEMDKRVLTAKVETYDPRLIAGQRRASHAPKPS